jgi:hypothetical protein
MLRIVQNRASERIVPSHADLRAPHDYLFSDLLNKINSLCVSCGKICRERE